MRSSVLLIVDVFHYECLLMIDSFLITGFRFSMAFLLHESLGPCVTNCESAETRLECQGKIQNHPSSVCDNLRF